ncbi:MAG: EamA family transporter [Halopseudomonas aestusnigri]
MKTKDICLALFVPLAWGGGFTVAKPAVDHFPPIFMLAVVYCVVFLVLSLFSRGPTSTPTRNIILISLFSATLQSAFTFTGLVDLPASVAVLVAQTQVPFAVLFAWIVGAEALNINKVTGIAISLGGLVIVVGLPNHPVAIAPVILILLGAATWGVGQAVIRQFSQDSGARLLKMVALHAVPQLLIISAILEEGQIDSLLQAKTAEWAALLFVSLIGYSVAYAIWFSLLGRNRVDSVTPFVLLMPVAGVVSSAILLQEAVEASTFVGGGVLLLGVGYVVLSDRMSKRVTQELNK